MRTTPGTMSPVTPARAVPDELDPAVVAGIDKRLDDIESQQGVTILWAIESGSRAWGFPSPDSDYDGRFIYAHRVDGYLTPWLPRDVIETPMDRVYDVNGWDLRKTLDLITRGHATALEWLRSPIVYRGDAATRDELLALAARIAEPELLARHYAHVGQDQWDRSGASASGGTTARLKGVFYALRPAAVLNWMLAHPGDPVPPMNLHEVLAEAPVPADVAAEIETLLDAKARTRELGAGQIPPAIARFVTEHIYNERWAGSGQRRIPEDDARADAAEVFRSIVHRISS